MGNKKITREKIEVEKYFQSKQFVRINKFVGAFFQGVFFFVHFFFGLVFLETFYWATNW